MPETAGPPFTIPVTLIIEKEISAEAADSIQCLINLWRDAIDPELATMGEVRQLTADRVSLAEVDATLLVDLFAESYDGDMAIGARPVQH